uniref:Uncharacterized protein n=1 Tax=Prasinoderma singulare TaxID=676789 RepID=A0A7S3BUF8_9VIRI
MQEAMADARAEADEMRRRIDELEMQLDAANRRADEAGAGVAVLDGSEHANASGDQESRPAAELSSLLERLDESLAACNVETDLTVRAAE